MDGLNTAVLSTSERGIRAAASLLRSGETVAFPTETVYGLGADATQDRAVARIFEAKERPRFNPLIVHVADLKLASSYADFSFKAKALADAFWPGALTLVLPRKHNCPLADLVSGGLNTVALRVPAHQVAKDLLAEFNGPVAAPSANRSGRISPTTADHVLGSLRGRISAVIDGGACDVGVESTIIGFDGDIPVLLRPGGIPFETLRAVVPDLTTRSSTDISAPGQLASHYAPNATLRLNAETPAPDELLLAFGPLQRHKGISLSEAKDLREAAATLFAALHEIDTLARKQGLTKIAVQPIPDIGLGEAINDRLIRAAAPRIRPLFKDALP